MTPAVFFLYKRKESNVALQHCYPAGFLENKIFKEKKYG